ncbi:MAG: hypothetical protein IJE43_08960 [Alphaproteobacteria bacterium]|nr:hypothetical protein [Alphaproteobacteria bacterium]MBQ6888576.1 hypothetical protein [Lachnospiraceae bacterium]
MEAKFEEVCDSKFHIAMRWIRLLQHGITIPNYLKDKNISSVIIYGATDFAIRLVEEFIRAEQLRNIKAISDKLITCEGMYDYQGIPCVSPDRITKYVQEDTLVIITPMGWAETIKRELEGWGVKKLITIQELIYDICSEMNEKMAGVKDENNSRSQ